MQHSPSVNVQLAIREAREAGLFDAPIRSTQVLDDEGLRLVFHLANGRAIPWPPASPAQTDPRVAQLDAGTPADAPRPTSPEAESTAVGEGEPAHPPAARPKPQPRRRQN